MVNQHVNSNNLPSSTGPNGSRVAFILQNAFSTAIILAFFSVPLAGLFLSHDQIINLANLVGLTISKKYVYVFTGGISAIAGAVLGVILGALKFSRFEQRDAQLSQTIASSGGQMIMKNSPELAQVLQKYFLDFKTDVPGYIDFSDEDRGIFLINLHLYRLRKDDQEDINRGGFRSQTIVYFISPSLELPGFTLQPNSFMLKLYAALTGLKRITNSVYPEFSRNYHLTGENMEQVRKLFDGASLEFLSQRKGYHLAGKDHEMVMWKKRKELEGQELDDLVHDSKIIFSLIEASARFSGMES